MNEQFKKHPSRPFFTFRVEVNFVLEINLCRGCLKNTIQASLSKDYKVRIVRIYILVQFSTSFWASVNELRHVGR